MITLAALSLSLAGIVTVHPVPVRADITCYDFTGPTEPQAVYDALPGDPYELDTGWPSPDVAGLGSGDQEADNGVACDAEEDIPERESPGNETYEIVDDPASNGLDELPDVELEETIVRDAQHAGAIRTEGDPEKFHAIIGIATPENEHYVVYEGDVVVFSQCGADAATERLRELLARGTTVWLEVDEVGFHTQDFLDRHLWIELDGRYRLVSEVLVSEGHAVVATRRPGAALPNANEKPGSRYRDALREAQRRAIETRVGLWGQCVFEDTLVDPLATP